MPQETKQKFDAASAAPAGASVTLPGLKLDLADEATAMDILERAFDYRGDVTLTLASGAVVTGYLFDRRRGTGLADSFVRLLPAAGDDRARITYADIRRIEFSERDPAAGKSFETWVKKYVEKKLRGEKASIESEPLE
jgi:hypothetical protein